MSAATIAIYDTSRSPVRTATPSAPSSSRRTTLAAFLAFLVVVSEHVVTLLVSAGRLVRVPLQVPSTAASVGNEPEVAAHA